MNSICLFSRKHLATPPLPDPIDHGIRQEQIKKMIDRQHFIVFIWIIWFFLCLKNFGSYPLNFEKFGFLTFVFQPIKNLELKILVPSSLVVPRHLVNRKFIHYLPFRGCDAIQKSSITCNQQLNMLDIDNNNNVGYRRANF